MEAGEQKDKGLQNLGRNNCFLNVILQALWQLDCFHAQFGKLHKEDHTHFSLPAHLKKSVGGTSLEDRVGGCVFCALKILYKRFQYHKGDAVDPDLMRRTLESSFREGGRFKYGQMDDAAEVLEAILQRLHESLSSGEICNPLCTSHMVFGIQHSSSWTCVRKGCTGSSATDPLPEYVHRLYVSQLLEAQQKGLTSIPEAIRLSNSEYVTCPVDKCHEQLGVVKKLLYYPAVFTITLIWSEARPSQEDINRVLMTIPEDLQLADIYNEVPKSNPRYNLRGMVCFESLHYLFFSHSVTKDWRVFNDSQVKPVGKSFDDVKERVGKMTPTILFYVNHEAEDDARAFIHAKNMKMSPQNEHAASSRTDHASNNEQGWHDFPTEKLHYPESPLKQSYDPIVTPKQSYDPIVTPKPVTPQLPPKSKPKGGQTKSGSTTTNPVSGTTNRADSMVFSAAASAYISRPKPRDKRTRSVTEVSVYRDGQWCRDETKNCSTTQVCISPGCHSVIEDEVAFCPRCGYIL